MTVALKYLTHYSLSANDIMVDQIVLNLVNDNTTELNLFLKCHREQLYTCYNVHKTSLCHSSKVFCLDVAVHLHQRNDSHGVVLSSWGKSGSHTRTGL